MAPPPRPMDNGEVARLNARIAVLESELADARSAPPPVPTGHETGHREGRERWRTIVAGVLITLACLLAPLSVLAVWSSTTVSDTDRYVQTVAPLAKDPDVQAAVTDAVTKQVFTYVDVSALTIQLLDRLQGQGLPPRLADQLEALPPPRGPQARAPPPPHQHRGAGVRPRPGRKGRAQPRLCHRVDRGQPRGPA